MDSNNNLKFPVEFNYDLHEHLIINLTRLILCNVKFKSFNWTIELRQTEPAYLPT